MGFLRKSIKDMKAMTAAAPGMVEQANQLAAQAQQMQAAQQAQAAQMQAMMQGPTITPGDPRLEPIAGVTIEQYATISKAAATAGADENTLVAWRWAGASRARPRGARPTTAGTPA